MKQVDFKESRSEVFLLPVLLDISDLSKYQHCAFITKLHFITELGNKLTAK